MITYSTWSPETPAFSRAPLMATPPRSAPERSLREPSRRPMGVRAPATMTEPDMGPPASKSGSFSTLPTMCRARGVASGRCRRCRTALSATSFARCAMTAPLDDSRMFTCIDHVGIAVPDLDEAIAFYRDTFGMTVVHEETNEEQGVREAMVAVGDSGSCVQLLAPLDESSTIAKFLDRSGPGLQQLAYRVTDVEQVSAILRERGLRLLYDAPKRGTADSRINFIHPKDAGGVLVELVEPAASGPTLRDGPHPAHRPLPTGNLVGSRPRPEEQHVQQILDAILAGDTTGEDFAALPLPESYRAATVHKDEVDMFEGLASRDKDPRKSLHVDDVRAARARPGRGPRRGDGQRDQLQHRLDLDLRAGLDLRLPGALRPDLAAGQAARPALPRGRLRPRRRRAQDRPRRARLEARRRGRRALPLGRAGEPRRPQRHDARPGAAHLGLRDQLRRPGRTSRWSSPTS